MSIPRFFIDVPLTVGNLCELPRATTRHALRALRMRQGEALTLFNGNGGEYAAKLVVAKEPNATADIIGFDPREAELPWPITVGQGLSSGDKMGWAVEKAVELGASAIQPLAMARCVTRLSGERATARRAHWQALAIAAGEQCGRNRVAQVGGVMPLRDWLLEVPSEALKLMLVPVADTPLFAVDAPAPGHRVALLIGPEGGFAEDEDSAARDAGFIAISLGPRVLRTETAAAAALAMLAAHWRAL